MYKKIFVVLLYCHLTYALNTNDSCLLLTEDYHILTKSDLIDHNCSLLEKHSPIEKAGCCSYWQCFPTDQVSMHIEDYGYAVQELSGTENLATLVIETTAPNHEIQNYVMRRAWALSTYQDSYKKWNKLMKKEKYVCFSGEFGIIENKNNQKITTWIFKKIKTKKGCASYFEGDCKRES